MNSVVLIGRLTRDPELSYTPDQTAVAHFTLAVDRIKRDEADFIRITVFGRQAENCDRYLAKGRQAAVLGRIQTGSYKDRNGNTVYTTDVIADRVEFLNSAQESSSKPVESPRGYTAPQAPQPTGLAQVKMNLDDLPDTFQQAEDDVPF